MCAGVNDISVYVGRSDSSPEELPTMGGYINRIVLATNKGTFTAKSPRSVNRVV